jgi:hypothetical protein
MSEKLKIIPKKIIIIRNSKGTRVSEKRERGIKGTS